MTARPATVELDVNSLYIVTQPLIHGAFHWSFIHTDHAGDATRHHWVEVKKNGSRMDDRDNDDASARAEEHACQRVGHALSRTKNSVILGYFKVQGYIPVPHDQFVQICKGTFPVSYRTVDENRKHTLTCRTWITSVLDNLVGRNCLRRADTPADIEKMVKEKSRSCESVYMSDFLWGRLYSTVVACI